MVRTIQDPRCSEGGWNAGPKQIEAKLNKAGAKQASPKEGGSLLSLLPHSKVSGSGRMGMRPSFSNIPFEVFRSIEITQIQVIEETIPVNHRSYPE